MAKKQIHKFSFICQEERQSNYPDIIIEIYKNRKVFLFFSFTGHEYPYAIKMKHLKNAHSIYNNNRSFDGEDHLSYQTNHTNSSTSLNNVTTTNYHDFELRKRDTLTGKLFVVVKLKKNNILLFCFLIR